MGTIPTAGTLHRISKALGRPVAELLEMTGPRGTKKTAANQAGRRRDDGNRPGL